MIPAGVNPHQSWAKGAELEKAFSTHSVTLASDIEKVVSEAKEGNEEALTSPLQKYVTSVCTETYQNLPDGNVPEWVVLAKGQINEILVAKVKTWWTDILTYTQPGKKPVQEPIQKPLALRRDPSSDLLSMNSMAQCFGF